MTIEITEERFEEIYHRIGEVFAEGLLVSLGTDGDMYEATFEEIVE